MDSTISQLFSAINGNEHVMNAFVIITDLQDSFTAFILKSYGTNVDISMLMRRFQNVFAEYFRSEIKKIINFPQFYVNESSISNYKIIIRNFMLDSRLWRGAFDKFKKIIQIELNMRSTQFEYALANITEFSDGFNKYMANFAKTNQIVEESDMYCSKFNHLKQMLQNVVDERIKQHREQHFDICEDLGCNYGASIYALCTFCTDRREQTWLKRLNEYIQSEFDSFEVTPIPVYCRTEIDEKESRCDDYTKRTNMALRDKRRYLRNKGILTKDNRRTNKRQ